MQRAVLERGFVVSRSCFAVSLFLAPIRAIVFFLFLNVKSGFIVLFRFGHKESKPLKRRLQKRQLGLRVLGGQQQSCQKVKPESIKFNLKNLF